MKSKNMTFTTPDGIEIWGYTWFPDTDIGIKGVLYICHGMAETAARYERFANVLCHGGFIVYAHDQRGHGLTAGSVENIGYIAEKDSFGCLITDLHQMNGIIRKNHPAIPVFLFGHSMGSFVCQGYIQQYGNEIDGLILSGTNGKQGLLLYAGVLVARAEILFSGRKKRSPLLNGLSFGSYNNAFKPYRTSSDWLSRDEKEVDAYIANPFCGSVFPSGFYEDLVLFLLAIQKAKNIRNIPTNVPIYLVSGDKDPVGGAGKGVTLLYETYQKHGVQDLSMKLYPGARHELLNETNRDEVMNDVLCWLTSHVDAR